MGVLMDENRLEELLHAIIIISIALGPILILILNLFYDLSC